MTVKPKKDHFCFRPCRPGVRWTGRAGAVYTIQTSWRWLGLGKSVSSRDTQIRSINYYKFGFLFVGVSKAKNG